MTFCYTAINRGITWSAQIKARDSDHAKSLLRSIMGADLEILRLEQCQLKP